MFLKDVQPIFALVKKKLSILFAVIVMAGSTELGQLLRLPILVQHFYEHKQKDRTISFVDFLILHYETSDDNKEFDPKDSSLPFKSVQFAVSAQLIALPPAVVELPHKPIILFLSTSKSKNEIGVCSSYLSSIWQPPKYC